MIAPHEHRSDQNRNPAWRTEPDSGETDRLPGGRSAETGRSGDRGIAAASWQSLRDCLGRYPIAIVTGAILAGGLVGYWVKRR